MQNKNLVCNFFVVFIFFIAILFLVGKTDSTGNIKYVKITEQSIKVDLALTNTEQEQGLSGRSALKENEGMLFIFPKSGNYPFWMKDMNFPIDIIWIDEYKKVVFIEKNVLPESYPEIYGPSVYEQDAKYVLEIVSGFSAKHNLQVGDRVEFTY